MSIASERHVEVAALIHAIQAVVAGLIQKDRARCAHGRGPLAEVRFAIEIAHIVIVIGIVDVRLMPRQLVDQFVEVIAHDLIDHHQFAVEVVEDGGHRAQPRIRADEAQVV